MIDADAISDDVCLAAVRGWSGYPKGHDLSPYQQSPETRAAWRKAIHAALVHLSENGHEIITAEALRNLQRRPGDGT